MISNSFNEIPSILVIVNIVIEEHMQHNNSFSFFIEETADSDNLMHIHLPLVR